MSTQQQNSAEMAVKFLRKYATVIGTLEAIDKSDKEFLQKYATVVGSPEAIENLPDAEQPTTVSDDDETPEVPTDPTEPTDPAGVGEGTDNQGD